MKIWCIGETENYFSAVKRESRVHECFEQPINEINKTNIHLNKLWVDYAASGNGRPVSWQTIKRSREEM